MLASLRSPRARPISYAAFRSYSTPPAGSSNIKLVAEIRKLTNAPISKARQAVAECNGDFQAALKWVEQDMVASGAAKAEKVKGREAKEGLVALSVPSNGFGTVKAAIVELNCESDFVARTEQFGRLAQSIARTVSEHGTETSTPTFQSLSAEELLQLPLFESSKSVEASITDTIAMLGENITLRRAANLFYTPEDKVAARVGAYAHGPPIKAFPMQGKMGALSLASIRMSELSKQLEDPKFVEEFNHINSALAKQIVGFSPTAVGTSTSTDEAHLYAGQFMMYGGEDASLPVHEVLDKWRKKWSLENFNVDAFLRWQLNEAQ
ncbi:elongation factor Ts, mitochondrial [Cylindrobasidium torrendii FP15055 ss-10]|uniref:Elongation factor Ts, mitochondrial n=1 Tax=Cylindrobasidium torrendii FP15055 ss-10 TaxID=1314674 RepID=A0A0D7BSI1_9AGAR|nr:elongation factor Ts, mitochondrial [Cylindrobasidium torrendii FP15055 ss-10]